MKNVRKDRNNQLATTKSRINYLVPEPNNHTTSFHRNFVWSRNEKNSNINE